MAESFPTRRALIVDDEFLVAFDLENSMRELGFNVCTVASNEKDAIELAKSNPPDVVVMDVYLGGTRAGIETARWLRDVCGGASVVFVTAHCEDGTLERIHEAVPGAPVLSKPVYRDTLANAVSGALH
jgi:DNA-binding NarL/FixJ family response regulator